MTPNHIGPRSGMHGAHVKTVMIVSIGEFMNTVMKLQSEGQRIAYLHTGSQPLRKYPKWN